MATATTGYTWASGNTVLPGLLNQMVNSATITLSNDEVTTSKILDGAVTNAKLATGIDASKLTTGTLPIARIADGAVSAAKLAAKVTFPNYAAGVGKAYNTVHQAAEDGFLCVTLSGAFRNGIRVLVGTTNTPALEIWLNGDDINSNTKVAGSGMLPIPKDIYYKVEPHPSFDGFETIVINWYPVVT
jgi:DNA-binding transcriptional regulator YdaS (Cro superfamily)